MCYGHIKSDNIVIQNIKRSGKGFSVSILYKSSDKVVDKPLSEVMVMLSRIPDYKIIGRLYNILPMVSPKGFVSMVNNDIRVGKCKVLR